jgi:hypothetical protein
VGAERGQAWRVSVVVEDVKAKVAERRAERVRRVRGRCILEIGVVLGHGLIDCLGGGWFGIKVVEIEFWS